VYSYFGTKIATYFAFLGMYTRWLFFPAVSGLATQLIDFGYAFYHGSFLKHGTNITNTVS
uniref:Anoctamin transmembrane domain-containing protein n=1 Tax=Aegilops tauschii subsp. strangulata TaxID=200361 RepID=A0A453F9H8_AEGTS